MQPTVRIAFDLSLAGAGNFFTLDDPIKGQLDNVGFPLAGEVYEDVSDSVRSVSVNRGRPRELTAFTAGQASVVLDNRARLFDPTAGTAVSPYSLGILPRKAIAIDIAGEPVFNGVVEDWDLQFSLDGDAITTAKSTDGFTLLAGETVTPGTATPEGSGVLALIQSLTMLTGLLPNGALTLALHPWAPTSLPTTQRRCRTCRPLMCPRVARCSLPRMAVSSSLSAPLHKALNVVSFTDDGTGVPFSDISLEFGTESLFTQVSVEYVGGTAVATAGTAVNNYGLTVLDGQDLLADSDEADDIAEFYLFRYSEPQVRINQLEVRMDGLTLRNNRKC
jgi:hypothetical protein